jgi:fibronectin type 3 domain-containing protein
MKKGSTVLIALILVLGALSNATSLSLSPGWNLISLPVQPANPSIASVLSGIAGAYEVVWAYPNQTWQVYDPNDTAGSTLTTIQAGNGYWIKMTTAGTLSFSGSTPSSSLSLLAGWNLVGYNGTSCAASSTAFFPLGSAFQVSWGYPSQGWQFYGSANSSSTLTQLCPGAGYWINVNGAGTWTLPSSGAYSPTGVTVTPGNGRTTIAWTAVSGATSYNIYWSTTTGVTPANGTRITGATNPYTQTGLTNGTTYYYVVTAVNSVGEAAASIQVSAIPKVAPSPAAPAAVTVTQGDGETTIAWTAVSGASSYNIYWSTTTGVTPANGTKITGATNPYTQTGLTNGTTYYYVVTAVNGNGESTASSQASCTPSALPVPTGVTVTPGYGQETIAWTAVPGATSYNIYWSTTAGVTPANGTKITHANSPYTQTGLTTGTTYYYVVTTVTSAGESAASTQVSAKPSVTLPSPPATPPTFVLPDPLGTVAECSYFSYQIAAPTGGAGYPYTFNLGTGSFPPLGIFVNAGGLVAGVDGSPPSAAPYAFDVCLTDAAFNEKCQPTSITVTSPIYPGAPSAPSPADNATGVSVYPTLTWTTGANTDSSTVYFGTTFPPPKVAANVTVTSYSPATALNTNTTYYWEIIANHNMCNLLSPTLTAGPIWSFTTSSSTATVTVSSSLCTIGSCDFCVTTCDCAEARTYTGTACGAVGSSITADWPYIFMGWTNNLQGWATRMAGDPECLSWKVIITESEMQGSADTPDDTGTIHLYPAPEGTIIPALTTTCPMCTCH